MKGDAADWDYASLAEETRTDRPGWIDRLLAVLLGVATVGMLSYWPFPMLPHGVWNDLAAGALIRPPEHVFPGFVRAAALAAFDRFPPAEVMTGFLWAGRVMAGLTVAFVYLLFRDVLGLAMRFARPNAIWSRRVRRVIVILAAMAFACSDAMVCSGQALGTDTLLLFLTVAVLLSFFRFLNGGRMRAFYAAVLFTGVICAESPAGVVLVLFLFVGSLMAMGRLSDRGLPLFDSLTMQRGKWRTSACFVLGFLSALALNVSTFVCTKGWLAAGGDVSGLIVRSVVCYGMMFRDAASLAGWTLMLVFVALPLLVAAILFARATDEDDFLPYRVGLIYVLLGAVALSQLCGLKACWFWTWTSNGESIASPYVRGLCALGSAWTWLFVLVVAAAAVYLRNNLRLVRQRFPELEETPQAAARVAQQRRTVRHLRRWGFWLVPLALMAVCVAGRRQATLRQVLAVLRDYVDETVREAGDANWIFTDGAFDAALELASFARGGSLRALSMMGGHEAYDAWLRTRGVLAFDEENRQVLENGAPDALRTWVCERPAGSVKFAAQIGFEFWKRGGKVPPPAAGTLVRAGMAPEERARATAAARALGERLMALQAGDFRRCFADTRVAELLDTVQWRLARVARLRAEELDRAGRPAEAAAEVKASDTLDRANTSLVKMFDVVNRKVRETGPQLTPREGLRLALRRADFALASRYAIPILNGDPADVEANFGMGMGFLLEKQYARAETHFRRVLATRPKEGAVLNNLAVCLLHLHRLEEAGTAARAARAVLPDSAEVKETLELIEKERRAVKKPVGAAEGKSSAKK